MAQSIQSKESEIKLNGPSRSLQHTAENIAERFEKFSHDTGKRMGSLASTMSESTSEMLESSRDYIREKPIRATALAAAAGLAAGFVITMLARRK